MADTSRSGVTPQVKRRVGLTLLGLLAMVIVLVMVSPIIAEAFGGGLWKTMLTFCILLGFFLLLAVVASTRLWSGEEIDE